ncbi:hypothetical protein TcasGA2_TC009161 [Tribolium castaneum]|uniref:CHK kinase-like domain-containing protein n=1 Tax=Tribolium castaneum TaxID=7070 RepID=D6WTH3_TRICA|nr:PREDICTED: uncharacterized protein LOC663157 [Tribolium castaneum]EFA06294.1 hypothetical protein TcasGA2_TC009161 [Tribolium castaneum]|eukprot:XP_974310.1 PREDICTED: uncharacterized protein LOC663157 [Tribolium castaneum]
MSEKQMREWLQLALKNENFLDFTTQIHGTAEKADGYLGKVIFLTVTGKTKTGAKTLDLVIKTSSQSAQLRKQITIKLFFQREIHVYERVVPTFAQFAKDSGADLPDFVPKCLATKEEEQVEMIVLENLKPKGYVLWDRKVPMDCDHVELVLGSFAKWHAFSLALRHKHRKMFAKLMENNVNVFPYHILRNGMDETIYNYLQEIKKSNFGPNCAEIKDFELTRDKIRHIFGNFFEQEPDFHVILHGDCWTNNFLFKLEENTNKPSHCCIIDWQCAALASPVMDLSFFVYTCVDTGIHKDVTKLLRIYYDILGQTLRQFRCDPGEIFTFEKLEQHWRQFSVYGLLLATFILKFSLCDAEEAPDFGEIAEQGKSFLEGLDFKIRNEESYVTRVKHNILHCLRNSN